jgi:hypothetical protein
VDQTVKWKSQLLEQAGVVFESSGQKQAPPIDIKALHAKIGELTLENDFLGGLSSRLRHGLGLTRWYRSLL